jgi:pilus assembly protein CpaE
MVVIDTSPPLDDRTLGILDAADRILLITERHLPSLKNASRFIDVAKELEYPADKVMLVVNRSAERNGIPLKDINATLKRQVAAVIPDDPLVEAAANEGVVLVDTPARRRPIGTALKALGEKIAAELHAEPQDDTSAAAGQGFLARLLGRLFRRGKVKK